MSSEDLYEYLMDRRLDEVRRLLDGCPALANELLPSGHRPISLAVEGRSVELVRELLGHGADVEARDARWVSRDSVLDRALANAYFDDDLTELELLLDAGVGVNYLWRERDGRPLLCLALWGSVAVAEYLIRRGADVNRVVCGESPLSTALEADISNVGTEGVCREVEVLIGAGADVNFVNGRGESLVQVLARQEGLAAEKRERIERALAGGNRRGESEGGG